jgi:polysaccharide pyruvyl transferase CsaB
LTSIQAVSMQAALCGYYGKGNGGDEALLAALLQMLPGHVKPIVLSGNPAETTKLHHVEAIDRLSGLAVLSVLRRSQVLIWGGGSLMQDATSALSPVYYAGLMGLAQRMGLKTIAWAQGVGPLHRSGSRWMARQAFSGCTAVSVRDRASAGLMTEWGIPFRLAPDPVWALQAEPVPRLWDLPAPRVAVVLRAHSQLTPARIQVLTQALADFQQATQTCILLIPFQSAQDLAIAQQIQPRLPGVSQILNLSDPQQLKGVFQGVEMAIAMRFHGLIMAAAAECRCFALSYDPKVSQLMQDLEMPGWAIDQIPEQADVITQTWLEHYVNGEALSTDQIRSLVDRSLIHQDLLREVLS